MFATILFEASILPVCEQLRMQLNPEGCFLLFLLFHFSSLILLTLWSFSSKLSFLPPYPCLVCRFFTTKASVIYNVIIAGSSKSSTCQSVNIARRRRQIIGRIAVFVCLANNHKVNFCYWFWTHCYFSAYQKHCPIYQRYEL